MTMRPRTVLIAAVIAAFVVFCGVQDRLTAEGAREYVRRQEVAIAQGTAPVTLDGIVRPAVHRSVRQALLWSGLVLAVGVAAAAAQRRR